MSLLKKLFSAPPPVDYLSLMKKGAMILDVRTKEEFKTGHIRNAVNVPLDKLQSVISELKSNNKPVITCCRSGSRSGIAKGILQSAGIETYNGGAWDVLNHQLSQAS